MPIASLDQDLNISFYSKNKNAFYDRTICLNTSGLTACEEPTAYLPAVSAPRVERLSGALAAEAFAGEKSEYVVISRDDAYYDALSGAGLAGALGAPILLTGTSGLSGACRSAVESLGATKAVVLGGENAVSAQVYSELEDMGLSVERVAGPDVYGTSMACTTRLMDIEGASSRYEIACSPHELRRRRLHLRLGLRQQGPRHAADLGRQRRGARLRRRGGLRHRRPRPDRLRRRDGRLRRVRLRPGRRGRPGP